MGNLLKVIIYVFLLSSLTYGQAYMDVDTNGVTVDYDLADVDGITFNAAGDTMTVDITGGSNIYDLAEVDSITFSGDTFGKAMEVDTSGGTVYYDLSDIASITYELLYYDSTGTVTDIDGIVYTTLKIGTQWWMAENLKVTHYRNGESIPNVTYNTEWSNLSTGAWCSYKNDDDSISTYSRMYNWYAVTDSSNIAPEGWHIPTDEEWKELEMYLGMSQSATDIPGWRGTDEGGKLKETGTTHWFSPNTGATNQSGFSALPGGYRGPIGGTYYQISSHAYFWSSTESSGVSAWNRSLTFNLSGVHRWDDHKRDGYSIRCVRD